MTKDHREMTREEHRRRHVELLAAFTELLSDWFVHDMGPADVQHSLSEEEQSDSFRPKVPGSPSLRGSPSLTRLLAWSQKQTVEPEP